VIPVARIRNNALRRAAMCVVFPALIVFFYALPLILAPWFIAGRALRGAFDDAAECVRTIAEIWGRDARILRLAWLRIWHSVDGE